VLVEVKKRSSIDLVVEIVRSILYRGLNVCVLVSYLSRVISHTCNNHTTHTKGGISYT